MRSITNQNFGIVIAYIVPGATALAGAGFFSETVRHWLGASGTVTPTISGFLFATIASIGMGVVANTVRRLVLDRLHHATGIPKREWNYRALQGNLAAVEFVVGNQFRFHQFHGNMLVSLAFTFFAAEINTTGVSIWRIAAFGLAECVFFLGSRESLRLYYERLEDLLGVEVLETTQRSPAKPTSFILRWTRLLRRS